MFVMGAVIALIISVLVRESSIMVFLTSYLIGFFVCLVYGLTTKG